jgi:hypothetical protein
VRAWIMRGYDPCATSILVSVRPRMACHLPFARAVHILAYRPTFRTARRPNTHTVARIQSTALRLVVVRTSNSRQQQRRSGRLSVLRLSA